LPSFALLLVIDVLIMRRVLAPIIGASRAAAAIGPSMSHARLPTENLPREVLPLALAVNKALDRLETGLEMQREFTADAAHELRTPLAVLRTHIDTVLPPGEAAALGADIDVMSRVVDQLLDLAELESFSLSQGGPVNMDAICADVVGMMAPVALAEDRLVEFTASSTPIWVFGNAEMLFRAVRNLVENAIRFTAPGTSVEVEIRPPATVSVKDRGPGVAPAERAVIFRRFWRHARKDRLHSGLGLAIVARTVQIHNSVVEVADRPGGGAVFSMHFPVGDASN
jgi:signal transduction histidine kinase